MLRHRTKSFPLPEKNRGKIKRERKEEEKIIEIRSCRQHTAPTDPPKVLFSTLQTPFGPPSSVPFSLLLRTGREPHELLSSAAPFSPQSFLQKHLSPHHHIFFSFSSFLDLLSRLLSRILRQALEAVKPTTRSGNRRGGLLRITGQIKFGPLLPELQKKKFRQSIACATSSRRSCCRAPLRDC